MEEILESISKLTFSREGMHSRGVISQQYSNGYLDAINDSINVIKKLKK